MINTVTKHSGIILFYASMTQEQHQVGSIYNHSSRETITRKYTSMPLKVDACGYVTNYDSGYYVKDVHR